MAAKVVSVRQAIDQIKDGDRLALGGFVGSVVPEYLEKELGKKFLETGSPKNIGIYFAAGQGDGVSRSINHLAHEGMLEFCMGGHLGLIPKIRDLINQGKVKGYNLPQGVMTSIFRDTAGGRDFTISKVGLDTYIDPRIEGGKFNKETTEDYVQLINIDGKEYLKMNSIHADVALLRGTTADVNGNISMEEEGLFVENLIIAQMVKNCGGKVIVQVKRTVEAGTINPQLVKIPGILVDYVVVCPDMKDHMLTFGEEDNPDYYSTKSMIGKTDSVVDTSYKLDLKYIIGRRCAMALRPNTILNLGIGAPEFVAKVADDEGIMDFFTLTVEPGAIGGTPAGGLSFGVSRYPEAIINQEQQFDFYDGGGLDQAFLGLAECDQYGNINVSRFGPKIAGCGGFINISQNTPEVYFVGTFTAGKADIRIENGKLNIIEDGEIKKFINKVSQITFSGKRAVKNHQNIYYVTERCVFKLIDKGLELIEIAPGLDLQKHILDKMDFVPQISSNLKEMNHLIFTQGKMNLKHLLSN